MSGDREPRPPATRLFIYGTLKRGGENHRWLAGQTCLGPARTIPGFTLYSLGNYPGLVADPRDAEGVAGELWQVDAGCLARLDELEGLAEGLYLRQPVALAAPPGITAAETYFYARDLAGRTQLGSHWPV